MKKFIYGLALITSILSTYADGPPQPTQAVIPTPSRNVIPHSSQNPQSPNSSASAQNSMEFPMTPRPNTQAGTSKRPLPTTPQSGNTGTFTFHKDEKGRNITSTFAREIIGQKGQPLKESLVKDILYIKGQDGKEYVWYDPHLNNQRDNSDMMKKYKVFSVGALEGKPVKFEPTGNKLRIEGKEYELVNAIATP